MTTFLALHLAFGAALAVLEFFTRKKRDNPYKTIPNMFLIGTTGIFGIATLILDELWLEKKIKQWDEANPPINATAYGDSAPCRKARQEGYQAGKITATAHAEMLHAKQRIRWKNDLMTMQGKIAILKNENNKLRNKLYRQQKQDSNE